MCKLVCLINLFIQQQDIYLVDLDTGKTVSTEMTQHGKMNKEVDWNDDFIVYINPSLWNKIYNSNICKSAYEVIEDGYFLDAEDWYAFIVICSFAKSYSAIEDKLYQYNWGLGITGGEKYTLKKYINLIEKCS